MVSFFEYLAVKALEAYCGIKSWKPERGQSTAEYVAVTAVAVGLAVTVIFAVLGGSLNAAVDTIADKICSFAEDTTGGVCTPEEIP